ncbi:uncharacterized protein B0H64DRAFT_49549 [Chaetomium fimeti]|uniref:CFEM domain-containing protein n=1 Tax=Chaetomium fimeti TaxID=1854472 RepID=A0AAE0H8J4_9PEZI|nr:hypothetical protein B0H64DRAFT_49549 [Chaetomium fimeti]
MSSFRNACAILGLCLLTLANGASAGTTDVSIPLDEGYAALPDCARNCFTTAISQSACPSVDAACLCGDVQFDKAVTGCIQSSCTIRESLTAKNITSLMCGNSPEKDGSLIPIYSVFIGLAVVAVILRLVSRVLTQAYFWWDDFANLFGFIGAALVTAMNLKAVDLGQALDIWFVPHNNVTLIIKMFFVEMVFYTITRFFLRASIILFYMRIFPPSSDSKLGRVLQYTMIFNVVYYLSFLFAVIFQCTPISNFWNQWEGVHQGSCGNGNILAWVAAATGIAFDLWLLALPFPQLLALNLHWKKKVMGAMMFFVGAAVMIISLVRLKTIDEFTRTGNPTKDIVQVCLWSSIELDVGVICPCLPSFRLLLRRMLPHVVGTSSRYELEPVTNLTSTGAGASSMRSGVRKSLGGPAGGTGGGGAGGGGGGGKIVVENTIAIQYGEVGDDGGSCASVRGLVEGRVSSVGDEESGRKSMGRRGG